MQSALDLQGKENVKDAQSIARCVCGWIIIPEKGWDSSDLTKQTLLWVAEFLNLGSSQGFLFGFGLVVLGFFLHMNPPVSGKTQALWLWKLQQLDTLVSDVIDLQSSCKGEF